MHRPRVLFVTPYPPIPPMGGGRRRQHEFLVHLATHADVTLASVIFHPEDDQVLRSSVPTGVRVITGRPLRGPLRSGLPLSLQWSWSSGLARSIEKAHTADPFQLAVVSHSYASVYTEKLTSIPKIIDAQNIESRVYEQFAQFQRVERAKIRHMAGRKGKLFLLASHSARTISTMERRAWRSADIVLCVSTEEQRIVASMAGGTKTVVVPNCPSAAQLRSASTRQRPPTVTFAAALDYLPNIDASITIAREIAPRLKSLLPEVRIVLAGAEPSPRLVKFCRKRGVEVIANPRQMEDVTGGTVSACPLRLGAGTRLKILDARQQGIPVVATSLAVEGLDLKGDPGVVICDDQDEFAKRLVVFLNASSWPRSKASPKWATALKPVLTAIQTLTNS